MFIDQVKIKVRAGKGGDGTVAFRREKFVSMGGPAGGSGGKGGSIIFVGDEGLSTLLDLRYNKVLKAEPGENGKPKSQHGKNAEDLYVKVPAGTTIFNAETNKVIGDITKHDQEVVVCRGGRGGRGNKEFANSKNRAPEISEKGEPGEELTLQLELKVLADVGLVGFPSVGKSTIISVLSAARPKIAEYHFTTLVPNLGVVQTSDMRNFVLADLPGLIEGASQGAGLGFHFLRHIERTRVIMHVVDMSGLEGRDPYEDFVKINKELESYKYNLLKRPQVIIANKMDLPSAAENLVRFKEQIGDQYPVFEVSAATKQGFDLAILKVADILDEVKQIEIYEAEDFDSVVEYTFTPEEESFEVVFNAEENIYEVVGVKLKRMFEMTDFSKDQSIRRFARQLRSMGVDEALRERGVQNGDSVRIYDFLFEFID